MDKGTCSIDGCGKPVKARGWCSADYEHWRQYGTPHRPPVVPIVDLPGERWLPVVDWEDLYEVSSAARVRSLPRRGGRNRTYGGGILAPHAGDNGYLWVRLFRGGRGVSKRIHKLVADAFLGPCPPGCEVLHGPNGILDNSVTNLSYGTPVENAADQLRDGTRILGVKMHSAKLTEADVIEIRRRHANGEAGYRALGREYGVDQGQIRLIVKRKNWKHVA